MPLYDYSCQECGQEFAIRLRLGDKCESCPHCSSDKIKKLYKPTRKINSETSNTKKKVGKIVDEFIKEAKQDVKKYKEELKKEWD